MIASRPLQVLEKSEQEQPSVLATMLATAVVAARKPIALLLPLNAAMASLRVALLALQLVVDRRHTFVAAHSFCGEIFHGRE